ncbi:MAG: hypothetical protein ACRDUV_22915 [Pseudonocardiaceae bacterium]
MTWTITIRLSDETYAAVKRYAEAEHASMTGWIEAVLDAEDMRRRCAAHGAWLEANPQMADAASSAQPSTTRSAASRPFLSP